MAPRIRLKRPKLRALVAKVALETRWGSAASAYTASRWLTRPARGGPRDNPGDRGIAFTPVEVVTRDAIRLAGWVAEPARPRGTIALFHGLRGGRHRMLPRFEFLWHEGYRVVSFDHRAHGRSRGRRISFGFHERLDVVAVHEWIRSHWPQEPIAALGCSMGAAALCYAAEFRLPWRALILEGIYRDIGAAFQRRIGTYYPAWFGKLFPRVVGVTEQRLKLSLAQLAPVNYVAALGDFPKLFVTGTLDRFAPPEDAMAVCNQCLGARELWIVPGAGHSDIFDIGGETYRLRIREFLHRALAPGSDS